MITLPKHTTKAQLYNFIKSVRLTDSTELNEELLQYSTGSLQRFLITYSLVRELEGECLELGSNPYFTYILLEEFSKLNIVCSNFFGKSSDRIVEQKIHFENFNNREIESRVIRSYHFNMESESFPFKEDRFDVILFCEVLEHLTINPLASLLEIKRVLKPGGHLILTTPNVARLENLIKLALGRNIYDAYSFYGIYGRHNREYTKAELSDLMNHMGFSIETIFTADVHQNIISRYCKLLKKVHPNWGQYIFIRARNEFPVRPKKPSFLYQSYPD